MKAGLSPFPSADIERLFALTQDLLCVAGADGYFKQVNPAFTRTLGWREEELLARPFLHFIHPDDRARTDEQARVLAGGEPVHGFENRYRCADGSWRWISWSITPQPDAPLVYAVGRDITERRRLEEELRAGEARFRAISEHCSDLIRILSAESVLLYASPSHLHVLGYAPEELLHRPSPDFIHPDDVEHARAEFAAVVAQGGTRRVTLRMRHREGGYRTLEAILHNRLDDPAVRGIVVTSRDVTERTRAEEALRETEQRLRAVYGAMTCGVLVLDAAGEVVEVNAAGQEIVGLHFDALRRRFATNGHVLAMLREDGSAMPPEERPSYRALVTGLPARDVVMGFRRLDGTERWVQMDAVPLYDSAGAVRHVVASFTDITALHQAEQALRRETARRAAIIAAQQDVAEAGLDLETVLARITERSQALAGADGAVIEMIDGEEMLYRAAGGLAAAHVGMRLRIAASLSGLCVRSGEVLRCDDTETDARVDREACRRLGTRSMILTPLRQAGQTVGVLKVLSSRPHAFETRDVDALRVVSGVLGAALGQAAAFAALRASEERYRQVEQHAPIGLALVAPDGRFLRVNPALCALVGYAEEELLARTFQDITHPEDLDADLSYVRQMLAGAIATYQMEKRYIRKDGAQVWIALSVSLVRDDAGRPEYFVAQINDIDARKRAEQALQASHQDLERSNAELAQFAYVASHDLQEPLRTITSYLQLLQRRYRGKPLDATADEFIAYAVGGAGRMQALIRDVLAYSRVGTHGAAFAPVDCAAVVGQVLTALGATIAERGAVVRYEHLPVVWGDAMQIGQLFQNLIGNALKFCRHSPEVTISAERDGERWLLRVADNGIGIDPAHAERVFEMFRRLHTRAEYAGTGIGLAICKRIVERHDGRIWVESLSGQGATFLFTLPGRPEGA